MKTAVFGGGCFWCTEAVFTMLEGVAKVEPGYAGGSVQHPTYEQVSTGKTGHAEVIRVTYDPNIISYQDLLTVFFASHDPASLNRQGGDVGPQYRSIILYTNDEEYEQAREYIHQLRNTGVRVVTEIEPLEAFYLAEEYHANYFQKNKSAPYCQLVVEPKLEKMRARYASLVKGDG